MKFKFNLKRIFSFLFFTLLLNNFTPIFCSNDFDDYDLDDIYDTDINFDEWEEDIPLRQPIDEETLKKLIEILEGINDPIWKSTKPPKGRDVLYLIPHKLLAIEYGGVVANIFFNYTNRMSFNPQGSLKLDTNEKALNAFIQLLAEDLSSQEISSIIPLFKRLSIQERKAGALIQAGFFHGPFTFQLNTSLQMSERNFWLNKKDQADIKQMFENFDGTFDENELYLIKYGLGDTRLKVGLNSLNMSNFEMDIGFEGIFPTSKISSIPRLKKYNIDFDNFQESLPNVLYSIRDSLITPQLGNGGHLGLGCYIETKLDLFHDSIHLWNRISFDNLFTAEEDRLIPSTQTIPAPADDPAGFLIDIIAPLAGGNPEPATEFLKQYIFPPPYRVTVKPGGIFNFITTISFDLGRKWVFGLGYDFYMQQRERFDKILNENIEPTSLRISDAEADMTYQHKIFAEANYIKKQKKCDLNLGIGGDYTISSKHIGHDWTIFVRLGVLF